MYLPSTFFFIKMRLPWIVLTRSLSRQCEMIQLQTLVMEPRQTEERFSAETVPLYPISVSAQALRRPAVSDILFPGFKLLNWRAATDSF